MQPVNFSTGAHCHPIAKLEAFCAYVEVFLPSPQWNTIINLEEPDSSGYPAQTVLTWRNQILLVTQPKQD